MEKKLNTSINIITCWWTIDKDYSIDKWSYYFTFWEPAIKKILNLPMVRVNENIEICELMNKDSLDMNDIDRELIRKKIEEIEWDRVLITHGTDTMINTWKILREFTNDKVIILTWSSIPENFRDTDAHLNIWFALWVLKVLANEKKYGVYIAMNWEYFDIFNVKKMIIEYLQLYFNHMNKKDLYTNYLVKLKEVLEKDDFWAIDYILEFMYTSWIPDTDLEQMAEILNETTLYSEFKEWEYKEAALDMIDKFEK